MQSPERVEVIRKILWNKDLRGRHGSLKICRRAGGWQERPLLWCLHAVSLARDKNPFALFADDVRERVAARR